MQPAVVRISSLVIVVFFVAGTYATRNASAPAGLSLIASATAAPESADLLALFASYVGV